jgi:drug/metabolite transporter (DMT)-like permease
VKIFILLSSLILTQVWGDICLGKGMSNFGELNLLDPSIWPHLIIYLVTNFWILMGFGSLIMSLFIYLTAISQLDLSYVLPIQAFSYVLNALLAWLILKEEISGMRWLSTSIITIGVVLVGLSESQKSKFIKISNINTRNIPFFIPFSVTFSKSWLAIFMISFSDSVGDILLAMGMRQIGKVGRMRFRKMLKLGFRIVTNPVILLGVFFQTLAFFNFIAALSWTDISFIRPATALTYLLSLLGARFILHEKIRRHRLVGIIIIGCGILIHR